MSTSTPARAPVLGKSADGAPIEIDVDRLVTSRMLLTANSGGGKSWTLRRVLEQTHGRIQQLVIDPEGEFHTLRERHDFVLAAKGGDCPAEPRSAALLARRLLELGTSAVLDLYELAPRERVLFVRRFLESLMSAPRELWHPVLVVVDEAHTFAPENGHGEAESSAAVAALMSQGRKRGFCGLLATQRLAKLSKDVAAEANNLWIGRMVLDVDVRRAAGPLGLTPKEATAKLKSLDEGHGFAFGPALSREVVDVVVGPVHTTHPRPGQAAPPPTPPRDRVRKLLGQLADLPKEAEEEARTLADATEQIKSLRRELAAAQKAQPPVRVDRVEVPVLSDRALERLETLRETLTLTFSNHARALREVVECVALTVTEVRDEFRRAAPKPPPASAPIAARTATAPRAPARAPAEGNSALARGERSVLVAIAQHPAGVSRDQLSVLTGYKRSTRDTYLQRLGGRGLVDVSGSSVLCTAAGRDALGSNFEPLPVGEALRDYWLARLPEGERRVLEAVLAAYPALASGDAITEATGYKRSTRDTYLQRLAARRLVERVGRGETRASETLFG